MLDLRKVLTAVSTVAAIAVVFAVPVVSVLPIPLTTAEAVVPTVISIAITGSIYLSEVSTILR